MNIIYVALCLIFNFKRLCSSYGLNIIYEDELKWDSENSLLGHSLYSASESSSTEESSHNSNSESMFGYFPQVSDSQQFTFPDINSCDEECGLLSKTFTIHTFENDIVTPDPILTKSEKTIDLITLNLLLMNVNYNEHYFKDISTKHTGTNNFTNLPTTPAILQSVISSAELWRILVFQAYQGGLLLSKKSLDQSDISIIEELILPNKEVKSNEIIADLLVQNCQKLMSLFFEFKGANTTGNHSDSMKNSSRESIFYSLCLTFTNKTKVYLQELQL
ncbi:uncharacterized protein CMU_017960 [Cryptosporidium muris RN66]|uniref:Uncharacterized protein n=1 Tax=Cryptosporidium muris (strain RN66) TaxID=441375 RepID=B6AD38_CRYMR|nr:uncharacterized protein CMU_017960 [Cryptosporidium muris RN66]EEA06042.1 hypothetical protein CMU_017960 [Cryptosporidium muris RN66]|eukprot:XP_002140391.1 hypothetical protein [Cryptosporidium muris RN66]